MLEKFFSRPALLHKTFFANDRPFPGQKLFEVLPKLYNPSSTSLRSSAETALFFRGRTTLASSGQLMHASTSFLPWPAVSLAKSWWTHTHVCEWSWGQNSHRNGRMISSQGEEWTKRKARKIWTAELKEWGLRNGRRKAKFYGLETNNRFSTMKGFRGGLIRDRLATTCCQNERWEKAGFSCISQKN